MANFVDDSIDFSTYAKETEHARKVKPAKLWIQELIDDLHSPVVHNDPVMPWAKTHKFLQMRPGEVTVWGGANGSGKSLVTGQVGLGLIAQGQKICMASFEMKPKKTLKRMARQFSHFDGDHPMFRHMPEAKADLAAVYRDFDHWSGDKLWIYDQQGTVSPEQACGVTRYCAKELGIQHMFIDSLMKCIKGEDDYNGQKLFVDELCAIAKDYNIHIHLIHHIKKPPDENHKPTKYDYKGSGSITDQADNVVSVWRNKPKEKKRDAGIQVNDQDPDVMLICDKQRHGDWEGMVGLWFHQESQQFVSAPGEEPIKLMDVRYAEETF